MSDPHKAWDSLSPCPYILGGLRQGKPYLMGFFNHLYLIIVNDMQCTLISGTILVTDRPIAVFPMGYMYRIKRRLSIN